jgi:hypothetical protein
LLEEYRYDALGRRMLGGHPSRVKSQRTRDPVTARRESNLRVTASHEASSAPNTTDCVLRRRASHFASKAAEGRCALVAALPDYRHMLRLNLLFALGLIAAPLAAQDKAAAAPRSHLNPVIEGSVEYGGARVVDLTFQNGSSQVLHAGQGATFAAGLQLRPAAMPRFSVSGTVGFKFVTNASDNADIGITRIPIEVVGRWGLNRNWWAGAGVVRHVAVTINGDDFFADEALRASAGATVELGWRWAALTYTTVKYTDTAGATLGAGSVGVSARWVVTRRRG